MNPLDRLISAFSPEIGVRRAAARQVLEQFEKRDYASAGAGRRNRSWKGRSTSANVEIGSGLSRLRDRSREFVRDNWAGQRILDVVTSHAVGTGIVPAIDTGSDRANKRFSLAWEEWNGRADIEGVLDFGGTQALAVRSMVEGGDTVVRFLDIEVTEAGKSVPFRLQGLEGDQIDVTRDTVTTGSTVRLGVQLGESGRRQGLYLHRQHPGEMTLAGSTMQSDFVAWGDLAHLYRPLRFGQVRGIPWFAPILLSAREVQDLIEAAIVQARTQASFAGFMHRQPGSANVLAAKKGDDGQMVTRIEPGMIADIGENEITFAQPSSQSAFSEVYLVGMQAMAAGAGLTYDQLTGDLRQANYSSLRAGKIEFRRLIEQLQWHTIIPRLCAPVMRRFIERGTLAGILPTVRAGYQVKWITPANEPIDPKKDLEADILAVRSGRLSPQEFISAWGRDWREVVADFASFLKAVDDAGMSFDIDPRKPANGQAAQIDPNEVKTS